MTRIQRAFRQLLSAEAPLELVAPTYPEKTGIKLGGIEAHLDWIRSVDPKDIYA